MLEIPFRGIRISIHFSFLAAASLLIITDESGSAVLSLYACILHELGHLAMMRLFRVKATRLIFYFAGIKIIHSQRLDISFVGELAVLLGGCAVNLVNFLLFSLLDEDIAVCFAAVNLALLLFNLLPLRCFDGGKILQLILESRLSVEKAAVLVGIIEKSAAVAAVAAMLVAAFYGCRNITLYMTLAYFAGTVLTERDFVG